MDGRQIKAEDTGLLASRCDFSHDWQGDHAQIVLSHHLRRDAEELRTGPIASAASILLDYSFPTEQIEQAVHRARRQLQYG